MIQLKAADGSEAWVNPSAVQFVAKGEHGEVLVHFSGAKALAVSGVVGDVSRAIRDGNVVELLRGELDRLTADGIFDVRIVGDQR